MAADVNSEDTRRALVASLSGVALPIGEVKTWEWSPSESDTEAPYTIETLSIGFDWVWSAEVKVPWRFGRVVAALFRVPPHRLGLGPRPVHGQRKTGHHRRHRRS